MNRLYAQGKKRTKNHEKRRKIVDKEYEKIDNKKRDEKNKFVAKIWQENDVIAVQDENITGWKSSKMKGWGRRIQHAIMGGIMRDIQKLSQTVIVDRWFASTKDMSSVWHKKQTHAGGETVYVRMRILRRERDRKAAHSILEEGIKILAGRG
ncbi:MAG: transposase [Spirochaetaceae bacterium]|jgi:transposase|nr:transposase [Spirochaetaceae bacterium]